jgi:hypothetical protein
VVGVMVAGCASGPKVDDIEISTEPTKFEGEWNYLKPLDVELRNDTYIFKGNEWKHIENDNVKLSGIFTYNEKSISFIIKEGSNGQWTQDYTFIDGVALVLKNNNTHPYGSYVSSDIRSYKNDLSTKFDGSWRHPNHQTKYATYTFTGNWFVFTNEVYREHADGIFIFDDMQITFIIIDRYSFKRDIWTQKYSINNGTLTLEQHPSHTWGPFLKK